MMGHGVLRSKVARRVFLLFIFCALLPLSALVYISYSNVTKELYQQAYERLHHANKTAGMAIVERLNFLEIDLKMVFAELQKESPNSLDLINHRYNGRLKDRFKRLALVDRRNNIISVVGKMKDFPRLTHDQEQHINAGKTLVIVFPGTQKFAGIFIVRSQKTGQVHQKRLFGEIHPNYLWGFSNYLSPMTDFIVLDEADKMLFSSFPKPVPLEKIKMAVKNNSVSSSSTWKHRGGVFMASYWDIFMRPQFLTNWKLVHSQSKADILAPLNYFKRIFQLAVILSFMVVMLLSIRQIRKSLVPIELLQDATRRVAAKDFSHPVKIETRDEFRELGESFNEMATSLEKNFITMAQINRIGLALSVEKNTHRLMETIIAGAKGITNADGGALYIVTDDRQLKPTIICIDSLHPVTNGIDRKPIPLHDETGAPNTSMVAAYCVSNDTSINIADIYSEVDFDFSADHDFDQKIGYRSQSFLSIPMKNHENEIIGVLQLINAQDKHAHKTIPFSDEDKQVTETIASQAAVALTKNKLIDDFKKLFNSLAKLIATAIDEKSPHVGEHCRRVPKLTMMLAKTVRNSSEGPFKDVTFSEEELYELKIASLLHDCGKVTSPVHIMDKATKLETIFDRIHLIETRFEIIRRDLQIGLLREKISGLENKHHVDLLKLKEDIKDSLEQTDEDLSFIRSCNTGESFMTEAFDERVSRIADRYVWINANGERESVLSESERYNLKVPTGTITEEERNVLNYHVVATSKMLESLSYPKSLRNVPKIASSHHEQMDGKGYPKGLVGDQIPLQGRIIAIADIFESLTAKNRPYKKGKTVKEALQIMSTMKEDGRIDPDLFDVFINAKVYSYYTV